MLHISTNGKKIFVGKSVIVTKKQDTTNVYIKTLINKNFKVIISFKKKVLIHILITKDLDFFLKFAIVKY